jgi:hypothetical protein
LFQFSKKVLVPVLAFIDLSLFLTIFCKIFEFVVYNYLSIVFKLRLNPPHHCFRKFNSISTNLSTCLNPIILSVRTQGQIYSV